MAILEVEHLSIDYLADDGTPLHAVDDVSFQVEKGRSLALVGESGCGKTTTMLALLRLLPAEGRIVGGQIRCNGVDLLQLSEAEMRRYRWSKIALIFQGAMNALNPVRKISDQIAEAVTLHSQMDRRAVAPARRRTDGDGRHRTGARAAVSAPVQRRDAPARHDCDGTRLQPGHPDRRRADNRPRRDDTGANP